MVAMGGRRLGARELATMIDRWSLGDLVARPLEWLDPLKTQFAPVEPAVRYVARRVRGATRRPVAGALKVMTWNIKFGGGRIDFWYDAHGDRVLMYQWEVLANLEGLAAKINLVDPDVLLVQEIDVGSRRVAGIDQVQWLLDHTKLNFGAYASQWRADRVPTRGLGRIDSGIATLSRYPVTDGIRIALDPIGDQDRLTRYFYLKRSLLTARVEVPAAGPVHLVNTHTAAFSRDGTKRRHLRALADELDRLDGAGALVVGGGDLNALPPGSPQLSGFTDAISTDENYQGSDYRGESDWLMPLYERYQPAVPLEIFQRDGEAHFTHSTTEKVFWNRKLDYLFTNGRFLPQSTTTHQDERSGGMATMPLSDHAPVSTSLALGHGEDD